MSMTTDTTHGVTIVTPEESYSVTVHRSYYPHSGHLVAVEGTGDTRVYLTAREALALAHALTALARTATALDTADKD